MLLLGALLRSTRGAVLLVGSVFVCTVFMGLVYSHFSLWDPPTRVETASSAPSSSPPGTAPHRSPNPPLTNAKPSSQSSAYQHVAELRHFYLKQLWKPSIEPNSTKYRPFGAFDWTLPDEPRWTQRMGDSLCIIDLDNRPFDQSGQIFGPSTMTWDDPHQVHGLSLGVLNHWLYAKIHGYRYYYVAIEEPADRRASWKKPPVLAKILKEHDVCVYLDSDTIFKRLDQPLEWLLNYWQLYPEANSLALAVDPDSDGNKDKFGKLYLNTGFIIAQNNPMTYTILNEWERCPDDGDPYPECVGFRLNAPGQPTDQGGFGTYVRYNYTDNIRELPCTEANGYPESDSGCKGQFIRHLWTGKHNQIKVDVGEQVPGPFLHMFHEQYKDEMDTFFMTEKDLMSKGPKAATKKQPAKKTTKGNLPWDLPGRLA